MQVFYCIFIGQNPIKDLKTSENLLVEYYESIIYWRDR